MFRLSLLFILTLMVSTVVLAQSESNKSIKPISGTKPIVPRLRFSGVEASWPPGPTTRTRELILPQPKPAPGSMTDEIQSRLISIVEASRPARELLGAKFVLLGVEEDPTLPVVREQNETIRAIVRYFNYTNSSEVRVFFKGFEIIRVEPLPGAQPHAGLAELEHAVQLASEDARLRGKVNSLSPGGIVVTPESGKHRVIYVTFAKQRGTNPIHWAEVDLTDERVLAVDQIILEGQKQ